MQIQHEIETAFDCIHADPALKSRTKNAILQTVHQSQFQSRHVGKQIFAYTLCAACMICFLFLGHQIYFTPTSTISIDVNPSVEMDINRFDRVIDIRSFNEDGEELAASLDVFYEPYQDAIYEVLDNDYLNDVFQSDELLSFTVTQNGDPQSMEILDFITECTKNQDNVECCGVNTEDVSQAHSLGLSYGRYRYYLEIIQYEPSFAPDLLNQMTMREIRELLYRLDEGQQPVQGTNDNGSRCNGYDGQSECNDNQSYGNGYQHGKWR